MATEDLKVKITADASQAKAEISKFKDSLKGVTQAGESATQSIGKTAVALAAALATLKAVKGMIKNAVNVAAAGDALKDNAQKVFLSSTAYQEWGYVLAQNGIEISALKTSMRKFSTEVASGSDSLRKYGITATDVDTAFSQAIGTIQNMRSETEKITAATELFGNRALELFPVLNLTNTETQSLMNTYRALGGTMSNELIAASDVCTDSITEMKMAWGGLRNLLAAYVIPIITKVVKWITLAIAYIRTFLSAILGVKETFGGKSGSSKRSIAGSSGRVAKNTGGAAKNLKKAAKHAKELKRSLMGIDELSRLAEKATSAAASSPSGGGGGSIGGGSIDDVGVGDVGGIDKILDDETIDKLERFKKRIEEIKEGFSLIFRGVSDLFHGDWEEGLSKIKEGIEKVFPGIKTLKEKWEDLKQHVKDITANIRAAIASKWADLKEKWAAIVDNVKDKMASLKAKVATTWSDLKSKWNGIVSNIKDKTVSMKAKIGTTWNSLKTKWNALLANFKGKTVSIGLKFSAAAKDLKNWINNNVFSKINKVFAKVPVLKKYQLKLAKGGVLTTPTTALMGEYPGARSNPEIVSPQSIMYETMMRANGDMVAANAEIGRRIVAAIEAQNLQVQIGDETIARSAQRGNAAHRNRTGKALITL